MRKINRYWIFLVIIIFSLMLIGCDQVEAEIQVPTNDQPTISASEHAAYKERRENFDKLRQILREERDSIITEFLEDPEDVYALIEKLYENEDGYVILWDEAKNLSPTDYEEVVKLFDTYQIHDGISIVLYHEIGEKKHISYEFGTYTIKNKNEIEVVWVQNAELYSETESSVTYEVIDQADDAFMILKDANGYWLVEIASIFKEESYTRRMFDEYYKFIENEKEEILSNFAKNPIVTSEFLDSLYANEDAYARLLHSAKYLSKEEYANIMLMLELNQWRDGIQTVAYNKKYFQKYYKYEDGKFVVSSEISMEIEWSLNFEDVVEDETYNLIYEIKNPREDAYLLLARSTGYELFRIIPIQKK